MRRITLMVMTTMSIAAAIWAFTWSRTHHPEGLQGSAPTLKRPTEEPKKPSASATPTVAPAVIKDGTYTGTAVTNKYGQVQVQIVVTKGKLESSYALRFPDTSQEVRAINKIAIPQLNENAIRAQGQSLMGVAGATQTSLSYRDSLQSALDQAGFPPVPA